MALLFMLIKSTVSLNHLQLAVRAMNKLVQLLTKFKTGFSTHLIVHLDGFGLLSRHSAHSTPAICNNTSLLELLLILLVKLTLSVCSKSLVDQTFYTIPDVFSSAKASVPVFFGCWEEG